MRYDLGKDGSENWLIGEDVFAAHHQGKAEALLCQGNGYLGQRAALEEAYAGQTRDLLVAGTFDRFQDEVTELPNLPDLTNLELFLDGERFSMLPDRTRGYLRYLDLRTGALRRELLWTGAGGKRFRLVFERFVSLENEHLIGFRTEIIPLDGDGEIRAETGIDGRVTNTGASHFLEGDKRVLDQRTMRMVSQTAQDHVSCCLHAGLKVLIDGEEQAVSWLPLIERRYLALRGSCTVPREKRWTLEKLCAVTTGRDRECRGAEDPAAAAAENGRILLQAALRDGYNALFSASASAWEKVWARQDILIRSDRAQDQLMVRFALYHLNIMAHKGDSRVGVGAKGLTGEGYKCHSFWDTETYLLPYYALTQPETARSLLEYRYLGLSGARKKAKENGYEGAMYPWETALPEDGEVTPLWGQADVVTGKALPILTGLIEQHITADIALAVHFYKTVTGDEAFMDRCGDEILLDTALFWASRVTWDVEKQAWVILDVIGPDEYKEHVNNNAYTNYLACENMRLALETMEALRKAGGETYRRLDKQFCFDRLAPRLRDVIQKIFLPGPDEDGIVPQFDGYRSLRAIDLTPYKQAGEIRTIYHHYNLAQMSGLQVHKQADTLALMVQLPDLFSGEVIKKCFEYYEARTLHDSSLSKSTHCVLAARLGETEPARRFFEGCGDIDMGPNMHTSDAGIHAASMGGIWQCAVYGFGGVAVQADGLHIRPRLPGTWHLLSFPLVWQGQPLQITISEADIQVSHQGDQPVGLNIAGQNVLLQPGDVYRASCACGA